jgi:hypothetical protein
MDFFAIGTDVYLGTGATVATHGPWTSAGCVVQAKPSGLTRAFREKRPCLNAASRLIKRVPGAVTPSPVTVTLEFDATQYDAIKARLETEDTVPVAVVLGDSDKAQVQTCWVESLDILELVDEGDVQMTVSFMPANEEDLALVAAATVTGGS